MRRFRVDTESAATALSLSEIVYNTQRRAGAKHDRARRASHLLLHWWAVGHDPARRVLRRLDCEHCDGDGQVCIYEDYSKCRQCNGTGLSQGGKL